MSIEDVQKSLENFSGVLPGILPVQYVLLQNAHLCLTCPCLCFVLILSNAMSDATHTIRVAAQQSGLSEHVIRVWEKRYSAVTPHRTGTNRRRYSDGDIDRLRLLRELTQHGHNIGCIAALPDERLKSLCTQSVGEPRPGAGWVARETADGKTSVKKSGLSVETCVSTAMAAVVRLDQVGLEASFQRAILELGNQGFLLQVAVPLAHQIGIAWQEGKITAAHEHFASAALKTFLSSSCRPYALSASAPTLVVGTPSGQLHEIGAAIAAAAAGNAGWRTTYLGSNLPASDLAGAVVQNHARAIALSIVYPNNDPLLPQELTLLRRYLPAGTEIIVGGRAASSYRDALRSIGAVEVQDLKDFYQWLSLNGR